MNIRGFVTLAVIATAAGCTSSLASSGGASGLPATKLAGDLSIDEWTTFCKWQATLTAGKTCDGGPANLEAADPAKCASDLQHSWKQSSPTGLTVAQFEACFKGAANNACVATDSIEKIPECKPLLDAANASKGGDGG